MAETFGKYKLIQKIAQGGMAEIFLATREGQLGGFEKQVAIKRIFRHLTGREETVKMFFDEARIAATLNHPNIVQIFDLGEVEGYFYIAMEFVHGTDVRRVCKRGLDEDNYLPMDLAARIVADTAGGLHYAHTRTDDQGNPRNIVHRDISPQNILLSMEGHVKICDFGIAKAENRLARTRTGQFKGKLSYMSPEQFNGEFVDARSDVFNLGIVLYEITLARRLFDAKTDFERMRQIANAQVTPPSDIQPDFPEGLEQIIMTALHPDPDERYQTAEQMQVQLENWLHGRNRKVGTVQISEYMEQVFPELVGGVPEDMSQVEFPSEGRETPGEGAPGVKQQPGGIGAEASAPDKSTEEFDPNAPADDATMQVSRDEIPTGDDSGELGSRGGGANDNVGSVTIDPSQSKQRGRGGGAGAEGPTDEQDDRTRPMQVDRDELEQAVEEEHADSTRPTPIREGSSGDSDASGSENFGVRPRHDSSSYGSGADDGSGPQTGEGPTREERPSRPSTGGNERRSAQAAGANQQRQQQGGQGLSSTGPQGRSNAPGQSARQGGGRQRHPSGPQGRPHRDSQPVDDRPDRRTPGGDVRNPDASTSDARPNPHANRGNHASGPGPNRGNHPSGPQASPGQPSQHRSQAPAGETGEQAVHAEAESSLRDSWRHSVDALTNSDFSLDNRRQKILAAVGFVAAIIGLGVFGYMITQHSPELSKAKKKEGAIPPDAGSLPEEPQVETVPVEVTTEPKGAHLVVNGLDTGATTPTSVEMVAGSPNELFLFKKGHRPVHRVVDGTGGKPRSLQLEKLPDDAPRQTVEIASTPKGATAYLDGRKVGRTPVTAEDVPAGHLHHLRLERSGYHPTFVILQVVPGESTPVSVNLAESKGSDDDYCEVVYDLVPQGSTVTVDGKVQGTTNVAVRHACEKYLKVEVARSSYETRKHYLHLKSRGKYLVRSRLEEIERENGKVELEVPDSLRVYIGSNAYGKGSVDPIELTEGDYTAVFETDDRERFTEELTVHPNTTTTYRVRRTDDGVILERVAN